MDRRYGQFQQKYSCIDFTIYNLYYTKISNAMTTVGLKYNLKNNSKQIKLKYSLTGLLRNSFLSL